MADSGLRDWPTGLFGCFEDWGTCCYGFFCTPCLFGDNSQALGRDWFENCFCWYCCGCLACLMTENRAKLRQAHGLKEAPLNDCLTYFLCAACALCQEARVLKTLGPAPQQTQPETDAPKQQVMV